MKGKSGAQTMNGPPPRKDLDQRAKYQHREALFKNSRASTSILAYSAWAVQHSRMK